MICSKCNKESPPESLFCPFCGISLSPKEHKAKHRGNGTGTVFKRGSKYVAQVTIGYEKGADGIKRRKTRSKTFDKRKDAIAALTKLTMEPVRNIPTLRKLYDQWIPTHKAGKQTMDCYKAAFKYFRDVELMRIDGITIEDYQECLDECGHGRRTQENMKACLGLMYKYGIPRHLIPDDLNLAQFLHVGGEAAAHREAFTDVQIERIRKAGTEETDTVLMMIYLGFRPSEFLELTDKNYDAKHHAFTGGAKTEAGKGRTVTVSPKILPLVEERIKNAGFITHDKTGSKWRLQAFTEKVFYKALDDAGIENPVVTVAGETPRHKYTPHSCRHTFATLMKRAAGSDKDKLALIGHTSDEQLRDYQDVHFEDLQRITDAI
jgi:integrase